VSFVREKDMFPIVAEWLRAQGMLIRGETYTASGWADLAGCAFDPEKAARRERRQRGWRPLHTRLVAVELKLTRVAQALRQALAYRAFFPEVYVAFPAEVAESVRSSGRFLNGVGLLSVTPAGCRVLIEAGEPHEGLTDWNVERQVNKFWRERRDFGEEVKG